MGDVGRRWLIQVNLLTTVTRHQLALEDTMEGKFEQKCDGGGGGGGTAILLRPPVETVETASSLDSNSLHKLRSSTSLWSTSLF